MDNLLKEKLESVGITVKEYARGPLGKDNFAINISGDKIRFWKGAAEIKIRTNKRKRQCLLTVFEKARVVKEKITRESFHDVSTKYKTIKEALEAISVHSWNSRLSVPNSTFHVVGFKQSNFTDYNSNLVKNGRIVYDIEHRTKDTTTTFLVGYDESSSNKPFICQLKDNPDSFADAYQSLLPKGVTLKDGHKRQGEWFFNPVGEKLTRELNSLVNKAKWRTMDYTGGYTGTSSHRSLIVRHKSKNYAFGVVKENRKGRHEDLILNGWHEVLRNNEKEQDNVTTWD